MCDDIVTIIFSSIFWFAIYSVYWEIEISFAVIFLHIGWLAFLYSYHFSTLTILSRHGSSLSPCLPLRRTPSWLFYVLDSMSSFCFPIKGFMESTHTGLRTHIHRWQPCLNRPEMSQVTSRLTCHVLRHQPFGVIGRKCNLSQTGIASFQFNLNKNLKPHPLVKLFLNLLSGSCKIFFKL